MGPAWELTNDEPSPFMLSPADIGDETNGAESQPNTSRADRQKKPKDSKATSASNCNCIYIVKSVLVLGPLNQT